MSLYIRLASPEEAPVVHRMMLAAFAEYAGVLEVSTGALAEQVDDVRAAMAQGGAILARLDGRPAGSARFALYSGHLYFGRLATLPEVRRQGVGRAMVAWLEEHARSLGLGEVQLKVRMSLPDNWRFYRALGYETVSVAMHPRGPDMIATMAKRLTPLAASLLPALLDGLVAELRAAEPAALAILLFGSLARGSAGPFSDIDLRVVTAGEPRMRDRVRFLARPDGGLIHLSVGSRPLAEIVEAAGDPERWPWLIETHRTARTLWQQPGAAEGLLAEIRAREPSPEAYAAKSGYYLETLLEQAAKLKNAVARGDDPGVRAAAAHLAEMCWRLLRPLNPVLTFTGESSQWDRICAFTVAPEGYAGDLRCCLGLLADPRPLHALAWRALRLAAGTVGVIAANAAALHLPDDLARAVADGSLARCLQQADGWRWGG